MITSANITDGDSADSPQFAPLVNDTASNGFIIIEMTADKAYSSRGNIAVGQIGGTAYYIHSRPMHQAGREVASSGIRCFCISSLTKRIFGIIIKSEAT